MTSWLLSLTACPASQSGGDGNGNGNADGTLTGELVFFFGRPAPEWTIPVADHAALADRLEGLTTASQPAEFPRFGPVGYRILNPDRVAGFPDGVLVQEGIVEIRMGDTFNYFADDKQLEAALRQSAERDGVFAELGLEDAEQKSAP